MPRLRSRTQRPAVKLVQDDAFTLAIHSERALDLSELTPPPVPSCASAPAGRRGTEEHSDLPRRTGHHAGVRTRRTPPSERACVSHSSGSEPLVYAVGMVVHVSHGESEHWEKGTPPRRGADRNESAPHKRPYRKTQTHKFTGEQSKTPHSVGTPLTKLRRGVAMRTLTPAVAESTLTSQSSTEPGAADHP